MNHTIKETTCSLCKRQSNIMIICSECPERFCPPCYAKCPEINRHRANHAYTIKKFYLLRESEFTLTIEFQDHFFLKIIIMNTKKICCSGLNTREA